MSLPEDHIAAQKKPKAARQRKLLTRAQWIKAEPPMCFIQITYPEWKNLHFEMATKWIATNCRGWFYLDDKTYIFELEEDRALFILWVSKDILRRNSGEI